MIEKLEPITVKPEHWERVVYLILENRLKINELVGHINNFEGKILSPEEISKISQN